MDFKDLIAFRGQTWEALENKFTWVQDMKGVMQDPIYHAEGDVATHTQMVIDALLNLEEYQELSEEEKQILWAAALLHDIEKRSTTAEENGRITSRGHAKKGSFTTRIILYKEIVTPFEIREKIVKIVRYHGFPLWAFEKQEPLKSLILTSCEVSMKYLYIIAKADVLGRICEDQQDLLYRLELFKEWCIEQNCWEKPHQFLSNTHRFLYSTKENISLDYLPFEKETFEVIMLVGLPGTGKDFYCEKNFPDLPMISLDKFREEHNISPKDTKGTGKVVQMGKEQAKVYCRKKQAFVFNATNIAKSLRHQWIDIFVTYGAKVKIIYLEVDHQTGLQQNKNREAIVPEKIIHKMLSKLEIPCIYEGHEVEYVIR